MSDRIPPKYDLLIQRGRIIDPMQRLDAIEDIAIKDGLIAAREDHILPELASDIIDAEGKIVTPGLIDLHTHVFKGLFVSVDADQLGPRTGVTTMVDAGTSGAAHFSIFRDQILASSSVRIIPFLNIWINGASTMSLPFGPTWDQIAAGEERDTQQAKPLGYTDNLDYASLENSLYVLKKNLDLIAGIKVWVNRFTGGSLEPVQRAKGVASYAGLPVMVCIYSPPPRLSEVVEVLREGDIQTHCYGPFTDLIIQGGKVHPCTIDARERGVLFDVGHGAGSFSFEIVRQALDQGFLPDTISSDIHSESINGPAFDLPTTMSKFMALGLSLQDVISATTERPAYVLKRDDQIGGLRIGMMADIAIFELQEGNFDYFDVLGQRVRGSQRLFNSATLRGGNIVYMTE